MKAGQKMEINSVFKNNGFVAILATILVVVIMLSAGLSLTNIVINQHKISSNASKSQQAYFTGESGMEDALLRLAKKLQWTSTSTLNLGGTTALTTISENVGGSISIIAEGQVQNIKRKTRAVYEISADRASFYYGAQVGEGGIIMENNSIIEGNIFSNGSIIADSGSKITGTAKVAKNNNKIDGARIEKDAYVDICQNSQISGKLTARSFGNCTALFKEILGEEIQSVPLPISQEEINKWKNDAVLGGTSGDLTLSGKDTLYLGPKKIAGNLIIEGSVKLFITGTIWVTGDITIQNSAQVKLDRNYNFLGGVIVADGKINLQNTALALGSGESGSYLLLLSTSSLDPAIVIQNSFQADILYTQNSFVEIQNSTKIREVTGYGIRLKNTAQIKYEVGLENAAFSSGPGGSWKVASWKEIE